jgi:hypothetical protein
MRPTAARPVRRRERRWRRPERHRVDDLRLSGGQRDRTGGLAAIVPAEQAQRLRPSGLSRGRSRHGIGTPSRRQHGDKAVDCLNDRSRSRRWQRFVSRLDCDAVFVAVGRISRGLTRSGISGRVRGSTPKLAARSRKKSRIADV